MKLFGRPTHYFGNYKHLHIITCVKVLIFSFIIFCLCILYNAVKLFNLKYSQFENPNQQDGKKLELSLILNFSYGCDELLATNIEDFISNFEVVKNSVNTNCHKYLQDFNHLYEVHSRYSGKLFYSKSLEKQLKNTSENNVFINLNNQHLIHVFNRHTFEHSAYNSVRAKRPSPKGKEDIWHYVNRISNETKAACPFCDYDRQTAVDLAGRHLTPLTVRVSNSFKIEKWHGMIITTKTHHPTNFTKEELFALLEDATQWVNEVHKLDDSYVFPNFAWDVLYKSGASQIHPHVHVTLSPDHYYGSVEQLRSVAEDLFKETGEDYFSKLVKVHSSLNLSVRHKSAVALSTIVGKGEAEFMLLSPKPSKDLYELFYFVLKVYYKLKMPCFSSGMAWPALGNSAKAREKRIPAIIRVMTRGDCLANQNDRSSLDVFLVNYRTQDPWNMARLLKEIVTSSSF